MTTQSVTPPLAAATRAHAWSLPALLRSLLGTRREMQKISALARRERLQLGYRQVPQRLWDRRSALFIER